MYGILFETELIESIVSEDSLPGYQGTHNGPVRVGNAAYSQIQNDNEGSVLMAVAQAFFDTRVTGVDLDDLLCILERLGTRAFEQHDKPDSGIWELRGQQRVHTFSAVMSWVACHRLASLCQVMQRPASAVAEWELKASIIKQAILERAWDPEQQAFIATLDGTSRDMDASLLLMAEVQFLPAEDPRFVSTVRRIGAVLLQSDFLMRYTENDDFGAPESAFNICTFWYIDALVSIGEHTEARRLFENMLTKRNHVGLLSEDFLVAESSLYGNFPQLYSMCGIIQSASKLSRSWSEIGL
jgi:GH15 family glucan-1,4-alpha-glucosidase